MKNWIKRILRFSGSKTFPILIGACAVINSFLIFVPIEALLLPSVAVHRSRWLLSSICAAIGAGLGAVLLSYLCSIHGEPFVMVHFPKLVHTHAWEVARHALSDHGPWVVGMIALSPMPLQPASILSGIFRINPAIVFLAVTLARGVKYSALAWAASHALPRTIPRITRK